MLRRLLLCVAMLWAAPSVGAGAEPAVALPALGLDAGSVTVSGLSSGGYMAVQLHVAYSATFRGAGVVAAGPYYCAQGLVAHATRRCLAREEPIPVDALHAAARRFEALGWIDALSNLATSRVYLFTGQRDSAVRPPVQASLARWYGAFVPPANLQWRSDVGAEHGMVTDDHGNPCGTRGRPYIQDCDVDVAGELLAHLLAPWGPLAPRNDGPPTGRWLAFDQGEFIARGRGMGPQGRLYQPAACEGGRAGPPCRLHVVLHGCGQNIDDLGDTYVRHTGYPRWADTNRLVLLFPQTHPEALNSCWDWWGYTGPDYAVRSGAQMRAIKRMVDRLAGPPVRCHDGRNAAHVAAGRALPGAWGQVVARGSGQRLGWPWQERRLRESPPGWFEAGPCPP
jgi:poly(3-hydroxybutyrate) depolymerase